MVREYIFYTRKILERPTMDTPKLKTLLSTEPENHTCYLAYFDHLKTSLSDLSWTDWTEFNNTLNSIESPHPYIEELKKESLFLFSALISKDDLNRLTEALFEDHTSSSDSLIAKYQSLIALGLNPFNTYSVLKEKETNIAADCLKDLRWHILVHYDINHDTGDVMGVAHFKYNYWTQFKQNLFSKIFSKTEMSLLTHTEQLAEPGISLCAYRNISQLGGHTPPLSY